MLIFKLFYLIRGYVVIHLDGITLGKNSEYT